MQGVIDLMYRCPKCSSRTKMYQGVFIAFCEKCKWSEADQETPRKENLLEGHLYDRLDQLLNKGGER